jgi:hypothetical protein
MPLAGIGIGLGTALAGGAAAGASLYGAHKQSSAATKAAQMQVDAANHAADLQKQSNDAALAFQKEQAARDQAMAEATRHGNYDLEAARVGRLGSLADLIGAQHPQMPGYVPLEGAPAASGGPAPAGARAGAAPQAGAPPANGNPFDPAYVQAQVIANLQKNGITPSGPGSGIGDYAYWTKQVLAGKGWEPYWADLIAQRAQGGGGGMAAPTAGKSPQVYGSLESMATTPQRAPLTPALTAPGYAYRPYSLNAMTRS